MRRPLMLLAVVALVATVVSSAGVPTALGDTATLISFEEGVTPPGNITSQYCNQPSTNKGVRFLEPVRLIEPTVGTMTPTHAATNHFVGDEFTEPNIVRIGFTADQSFVSVRVGLDRGYAFPVTAQLRAYTTATPSPGSLISGGEDSVLLGSEATTISQQLYVSTGTVAQIRSIEIEYVGPIAGNAAFEVFDNLMYPTLGPPCGSDTTAPTVQILEPTPGTPFYGSPSGGDVPFTLKLRATDTHTGVASLLVEFRDSAEYADLATSLISSFWVCGGGSVPACPFPSTTVDRHFQSLMPAGTVFVRVVALDFAGNDGSDGRNVTITPSTANVWARGLEVTQATQPWVAENATTRRDAALAPPTLPYPAVPTSVPLVAGRTTVARLFAGVEGTIGGDPLAGVGGALRCYTEPSYTLPCPGPTEVYAEHQPPNTTKTITVDPTHALADQRTLASRTLNFVLPDTWTAAGFVHLEAEVKSPIPECDGCTDAANRIRMTYIPFREVPNWHTMIVQVLVDRLGPGTATDAEREANLDWIRSILPINDSTVMNGWRIFPYLSIVIAGLGPDESELLDDLDSRYGHLLDDHGYKVIWGLTDSNAPGWESIGRLSEGLATSNGGGLSGAHEIGHALGLRHTGPPPGWGDECKKDEWCDGDWPWPEGGIGHVGFDVFDFEVHDPGTPSAPVVHDFMSYRNPEWISPRNWIRIFNTFSGWAFPYPKATTTATAIEADVIDAETPEPHLLVRGRWDRAADEWVLLPIYELLRIADAPALEEPDLVLELADGSDAVLATERIELREGDHIDTGDAGDAGVPDPSFARFVGMPTGTETVRLTEADAMVAARSRSDASPTVAVVQPTTASGFDGTIRWTWSDADGDQLFAMVDYRPALDSAWLPLGIDLQDDVLAVDPLLLPGGVHAQVRVTVTDGFNTSSAVSEPFTVADRSPAVEVLQPSDGSVLEAGRRVTFVGNGFDVEDDALPGGSLAWASDLDGPLGTGTRLGVDGLSAGQHIITITGTDSSGNTGSDSVLLLVGALGAVNHQPVADAGPNVIVATDGTVVLDGSESADADGDPLTFSWSVVAAPVGSAAYLGDPSAVGPTLFTDLAGTYQIELEVHDGWVGSLPDQVVVTHDLEPPTLEVILPTAGTAVQDGITLVAIASDGVTGTEALWFTIREDDGGDGIEIGLEHLDAIYDGATDTWRYSFDSTGISDGYYVIWATAVDAAGNSGGSETVAFSVRNWTVVEELPATPAHKAGRTLPIKFSIALSAVVDPAMPFIYNEDLLVIVYETSDPGAVLHEATFGTGSGDYRINDVAGHYITNFKTLRRATEYTVEVVRSDLVIGTFTFTTVRGKGG